MAENPTKTKMTDAVKNAAPMLIQPGAAPAFWMLDILWTVLVTSEMTNGRYSLIEQIMPHGSAPPPHVHAFSIEAFYLFDGAITYQAGGETVEANSGAFVIIPRNTIHTFTVTSETARVLNLYSPGGFEAVIPAVSRVAERRELPPPNLDSHDSPKVLQFLNNYWGVPADLAYAQTAFGANFGDAVPPRNAFDAKPFLTTGENAEIVDENGVEWKLLATGAQTQNQFALRETSVAANVPANSAAELETGFYVVSGEVEFQSHSQTFAASANSFFLKPTGFECSWKTIQDAKILQFSAPASLTKTNQ